MIKVIYSLDFKNDLKNIVSYIANNLCSPASAIKLIADTENIINSLAEFPLMGKEFKNPLLKEIYRIFPVKNYMIFYVFQDDTIEIRRILYAKMNYNKLFEK